MRRRMTTLLTAAVLLAAPAGALPAGPAAAAAATCAGPRPDRSLDVNGDGFADVVIGAPGTIVAGRAGAGRIEVRYGIADPDGGGQGLGVTRSLAEGDPGVGGVPERGDGFGAVLAVAPVDADACADVVIGVPGEDLPGAPDAGQVHVVFGAAQGLGTGRPAVLLGLGSRGLAGPPEAGDRFGAALSIADGRLLPDQPPAAVMLAVGAPGRDVGTSVDAGAVAAVAFTAAAGAPFDPRVITQDSPGVAGSAEPGAAFGSAVGWGGLGVTPSLRWGLDLLVGAPGAHGSSGSVLVIGDSGLGRPYGSREVTESSPGIADVPEAGDRFGAALDYETFSINGFPALAIGVPGEDVGATRIHDAGAVHWLDLLRNGDVRNPADDYLTEDSPGVEDRAEAGDHFGSTVVSTELWPTAFVLGLLVGVPDEDVGTVVDAGAVIGFGVSLTVRGKRIDAGIPGMPGMPEPGAHLGASVSTRSFIGGDLLIGVPDGTAAPGGAVIRMPVLTLGGTTTTAGSVWLPIGGAGRYGASAVGAP